MKMQICTGKLYKRGKKRNFSAIRFSSPLYSMSLSTPSPLQSLPSFLDFRQSSSYSLPFRLFPSSFTRHSLRLKHEVRYCVLRWLQPIRQRNSRHTHTHTVSRGTRVDPCHRTDPESKPNLPSFPSPRKFPSLPQPQGVGWPRYRKSAAQSLQKGMCLFIGTPAVQKVPHYLKKYHDVTNYK